MRLTSPFRSGRQLRRGLLRIILTPQSCEMLRVRKQILPPFDIDAPYTLSTCSLNEDLSSNLLEAVNRARKAAGYELLSVSCVPWRRSAPEKRRRETA